MYWQIAQALRGQIESGALAPGDQLPSELELQERFSASRNTVRDAMKWLTSRGMVRARSGRGTFVAEHVTPFVTTLSADPETGHPGGEGHAAYAEVRARGQTPTVSAARVELISAAGDVAARLRVPPGTQIVSRHQQRHIDGQPWSLQTTFYPMDLVLRGARRLIMPEDISEGTVAHLHESVGLVQVGYRDRIVVRAPEEEESRFFGLPDDGRVPVVSVVRTGYGRTDGEPAPFRVTFTIMPADRNQLVVNSGEVPDRLAAPLKGRGEVARLRPAGAHAGPAARGARRAARGHGVQGPHPVLPADAQRHPDDECEHPHDAYDGDD
jgi:GntR family transcriptional regulator